MEYGSDFTIKYNKYSNRELFFLSGRIGIKNILNKILNVNDKCLIPNYLCESIYDCFKNFNFYKIKNNFDIDYDFLNKEINNNTYKLIFIINYFGYIDININKIKELCQKKNIIIIEDYTHNLYSDNLYGDICICSYRKSIETPFGCIVIDKNNILNINQKCSIDIMYIFLVFLKLFAMILKNGSLIKYIWRPILNFCEKNIDKIKYNDFDYINNLLYIYYYKSQNKILRIKNIEYLHNKLKLKYKCNEKFLNTYFTYPILLNNELERSALKKYLISYKIYCPIYWPLDFNANKCNNYITDRILCIPIDQRYNKNNMDYIAEKINNFNII